jgi:hypothetical protein
VAILGTRGIPANYGGFETFAEELGTRLALEVTTLPYMAVPTIFVFPVRRTKA